MFKRSGYQPYRILLVLGCLISACVTAVKQPVALNPRQELGRHLFFEKKLSLNQMKSCASCHSPELAFSDGYRRSVGTLGDNLLHNAPSLINCSRLRFFDWANPIAHTVQDQIKRPLFNEHPAEMGLQYSLQAIKDFISRDSTYRSLIRKAYPGSDGNLNVSQIIDCICDYEGCLNASGSKFDRYLNHQGALSPSELNGYALFSSERLQCIRCHALPDFTKATISSDPDSVFFNTGLYNVGNQNRYPARDLGLERFTKQATDNGKFKVPSLRNVILTAPYMHDGSVNTIEEVIDHYASGGRNVDYGPDQGDGRKNALKSPRIQGFALSKTEKQDLINFLYTLTDSSIFSNPTFQNPNNYHQN